MIKDTDPKWAEFIKRMDELRKIPKRDGEKRRRMNKAGFSDDPLKE